MKLHDYWINIFWYGGIILMISNDEILNIKFKICDGLRYEVSEDGIVTVYEK